MTTQEYQQASEHFLEQARRELAHASEKGWDTATQMIIATDEQQGWEHYSRRHYHRAASRIRAETGDGEIRRPFDSVRALHYNFNENDMAVDEVAERFDDVEVLLGKLRPLLAQA